jgi:cytochrome P450
MIRPTMPTETPTRPSAGAPVWIQDICLDTLGALRNVYQMGGEFVAYDKGGDLTLFAFAPEHNRAVLGNPDAFYMFGAPGPRGSSQRRFSLGLFGLSGDRHRHHRRLLMPAFRKEAVEAYLAPITALVERHLARWQPGQVVDLAAEMRGLALKVTGKLLYGQEEFPLVREIAEEIQHWVDAQVSVTFASVLPVEPPEGSYQALLEHGAALEQHLRVLMRLRRAALRPGDRDLLALLLQEQDQGRLSEDEVIGEMHTLVNAAYQTTASALTWTLLMLALHPDTARDMVEEVRTGVALPPGQSLLDRVIKESLRIIPPGVFTIRRATTSVRLGALTVPPGTVVILSYFVTHHLASVFAEPEKYDPERWRTLAPSPFAYFPYGAGPRMCVGTAFAQQMLRITLVAIMRRYRLSVVPGSRVDRRGGLILNVRDRLPMTVHVQDGRFAHIPVLGDIHEIVDLPFAHPARKAA